MVSIINDFDQSFSALTTYIQQHATTEGTLSIPHDIANRFESVNILPSPTSINKFVELLGHRNGRKVILRLDGPSLYLVVATVLRFPPSLKVTRSCFLLMEILSAYQDDDRALTILGPVLQIKDIEREIKARRKYLSSRLTKRLREILSNESNHIKIRRLAAQLLLWFSKNNDLATTELVRDSQRCFSITFRHCDDYALRLLVADILRFLHSSQKCMNNEWIELGQQAVNFPRALELDGKTIQQLLNVMSELDVSRAFTQNNSKIYQIVELEIPTLSIRHTQSNTIITLDEELTIFVPDTEKTTFIALEVPLMNFIDLEQFDEEQRTPSVHLIGKQDKAYIVSNGQKKSLHEIRLQFTDTEYRDHFVKAFSDACNHLSGSRSQESPAKGTIPPCILTPSIKARNQLSVGMADRSITTSNTLGQNVQQNSSGELQNKRVLSDLISCEAEGDTRAFTKDDQDAHCPRRLYTFEATRTASSTLQKDLDIAKPPTNQADDCNTALSSPLKRVARLNDTCNNKQLGKNGLSNDPTLSGPVDPSVDADYAIFSEKHCAFGAGSHEDSMIERRDHLVKRHGPEAYNQSLQERPYLSTPGEHAIVNMKRLIKEASDESPPKRRRLTENSCQSPSVIGRKSSRPNNSLQQQTVQNPQVLVDFIHHKPKIRQSFQQEGGTSGRDDLKLENVAMGIDARKMPEKSFKTSQKSAVQEGSKQNPVRNRNLDKNTIDVAAEPNSSRRRLEPYQNRNREYSRRDIRSSRVLASKSDDRMAAKSLSLELSDPSLTTKKADVNTRHTTRQTARTRTRDQHTVQSRNVDQETMIEDSYPAEERVSPQRNCSDRSFAAKLAQLATAAPKVAQSDSALSPANVVGRETQFVHNINSAKKPSAIPRNDRSNAPTLSERTTAKMSIVRAAAPKYQNTHVSRNDIAYDMNDAGLDLSDTFAAKLDRDAAVQHNERPNLSLNNLAGDQETIVGHSGKSETDITQTADYVDNIDSDCLQRHRKKVSTTGSIDFQDDATDPTLCRRNTSERCTSIAHSDSELGDTEIQVERTSTMLETTEIDSHQVCTIVDADEILSEILEPSAVISQRHGQSGNASPQIERTNKGVRMRNGLKSQNHAASYVMQSEAITTFPDGEAMDVMYSGCLTHASEIGSWPAEHAADKLSRTDDHEGIETHGKDTNITRFSEQIHDPIAYHSQTAYADATDHARTRRCKPSPSERHGVATSVLGDALLPIGNHATRAVSHDDSDTCHTTSITHKVPQPTFSNLVTGNTSKQTNRSTEISEVVITLGQQDLNTMPRNKARQVKLADGVRVSDAVTDVRCEEVQEPSPDKSRNRERQQKSSVPSQNIQATVVSTESHPINSSSVSNPGFHLKRLLHDDNQINDYSRDSPSHTSNHSAQKELSTVLPQGKNTNSLDKTDKGQGLGLAHGLSAKSTVYTDPPIPITNLDLIQGQVQRLPACFSPEVSQLAGERASTEIPQPSLSHITARTPHPLRTQDGVSSSEAHITARKGMQTGDTTLLNTGYTCQQEMPFSSSTASSESDSSPLRRLRPDLFHKGSPTMSNEGGRASAYEILRRTARAAVEDSLLRLLLEETSVRTPVDSFRDGVYEQLVEFEKVTKAGIIYTSTKLRTDIEQVQTRTQKGLEIIKSLRGHREDTENHKRCLRDQENALQFALDAVRC